jgi:hypothetical protein
MGVIGRIGDIGGIPDIGFIGSIMDRHVGLASVPKKRRKKRTMTQNEVSLRSFLEQWSGFGRRNFSRKKAQKAQKNTARHAENSGFENPESRRSILGLKGRKVGQSDNVQRLTLNVQRSSPAGDRSIKFRSISAPYSSDPYLKVER